MGGCSSKPKTAEFEGNMESQEDKPHDEAPRKSLGVEKTSSENIDREPELSARSIQILLTEKDHGDLRNMFAVRDKPMIAGFSSKCNFKEERQLLEDDHQHVKQILAETINDSGAEKGHAVKKEIQYVQVNPEFIVAEFHKDPVFIMEVTKKVQEKSLLATTEGETVDAQRKPLTLSKQTLENEEEGVFSESNALSLKDMCIRTAEDASKLQMNQMGLRDVHLDLSNNLSGGEAKISELQKEPFFPDGGSPGVLEDAQREASSKRKVESKYHEAFCINEQQKSAVSVGYEGQENHFGEGSNGGEELCKETEAGVYEVVKPANGCVSVLERGGKALKHSSKSTREDEIKGTAFEEAAGELIIGVRIVKISPFDSNQQPSREIDSTDASHPTITTSVSPNNLQHLVDKEVLVQEDQEVDVDAASKTAVKDMKLQADILPVNDFLLKESNEETFDTTHGEGELISAKISMDDKASLPASEEPLNGQLFGKVQEEKPNAADEVTGSQVTATTKKPEAQSVHVKEFAELALSPAQDIPAPDIDEVLEKLASEFERQESLSRATS